MNLPLGEPAWDMVRLYWNELGDIVQQQWPGLSGEDVAAMHGSRRYMIETLQECLDVPAPTARRQVDALLPRLIAAI